MKLGSREKAQVRRKQCRPPDAPELKLSRVKDPKFSPSTKGKEEEICSSQEAKRDKTKHTESGLTYQVSWKLESLAALES
jgi:hypothetical protein